jgi:hypothetical protein
MKVCRDNCLQPSSPNLAKEWNCEKNRYLTAKDVTAHSNKIVWWIIENGHEWETKIKHRQQGAGCPYCKKLT